MSTETFKKRARKIMFNIRLTAAEKALLEARAAHALCSVSTYVRQRCIGMSEPLA